MMNKVRTYTSEVIDKIIDSIDPKTERRVENRMHVSARIKDLMDKKGKRNIDLAVSLGKTPSTITKWLSGTHNFTLDTLSDIETALGERIISEVSTKVEYRFYTVIQTTSLKSNLYSNTISKLNFAQA